jgi:Holliday junction resolvase RusA-like endonuclease
MMLRQLEPTTMPCHMVIKAQFEIPKSWTKTKKAAAAAYEILPGKPDIDNIAKIVMDSFSGVVFEDDAQVYDLKVVKTYGDPCLLTEVTCSKW